MLSEHPQGVNGLETEYTFVWGVFNARVKQGGVEEFSDWKPLKWDDKEGMYVFVDEEK